MSRILIIDDSALLSDMLRNGLVEQGFQVMQAMDANQGYAKALEFHPDLILLDIQLPDVIGFDLCRVFKNHQDLRSVPIIMVTGTAHSPEERVKGFQLGIDDFVPKPFDMPELMERVKAVLRRSKNNRSSPSSQVVAPSTTPPEGPVPAREIWSSSKSSAPSVPASKAPTATRSHNWKEFLLHWLLNPGRFKYSDAPSGIISAFLLCLSTLMALAIALSASPNSKMMMTLLLALFVWGILLCTLVMGGSILGLPLRWTDGARLFCMAGVPYLLKWVGAFIFTLFTTLSPFYYSLGPAIFSKTPSSLSARLDIFELWSLALLFHLLKSLPKSSPRKAFTLVVLVAAMAFGLSLALSRIKVL